MYRVSRKRRVRPGAKRLEGETSRGRTDEGAKGPVTSETGPLHSDLKSRNTAPVFEALLGVTAVRILYQRLVVQKQEWLGYPAVK